jgi:polyisoprenyl-phosphate glycosyltransferase
MNHLNCHISVIIPVYNDEEVLAELYKRLIPALEKITITFEIILIDDGSKDNSFKVLKSLKKEDNRLVLLKLTRNFGQSNAITAGLDHAQYQYIVIMDSDLQDPPEFIEKLLNACIDNECDMAIARRISRKDSWFKKQISGVFNKVSQLATSIKVTQGMGVFRVITKDSYDKIRQIQEVTGTSLSLLYWGGFDYVTVDIERDARYAGDSGYTIRKMFHLAMDRIFSYSLWPLRLATLFGVTIACISFVFGISIIIRRLFFSITFPGWASTIVLILFLFGVNFIILGIVGEYLGRVYLESKNRPKYLVGKIIK